MHTITGMTPRHPLLHGLSNSSCHTKSSLSTSRMDGPNPSTPDCYDIDIEVPLVPPAAAGPLLDSLNKDREVEPVCRGSHETFSYQNLHRDYFSPAGEVQAGPRGEAGAQGFEMRMRMNDIKTCVEGNVCNLNTSSNKDRKAEPVRTILR